MEFYVNIYYFFKSSAQAYLRILPLSKQFLDMDDFGSGVWCSYRKQTHLVISIIGVSFVIVYLYLYRCFQKNKVGPKSWPFLGACVEQLKNYDRLHDWVLGYLEKYDTIRVPMPFGFSYTYTTNPENVEYILKTNFSNFPKGPYYYENMKDLLGDGIFNSDGDLWRQQRKTASFEFASKVLRDFSTVVFREYACKLGFILAHFTQKQESINMQNIFMRMTLDSICKIGFGVDMGSLSPLFPEVPFATAFDQANYIVTLRFIDPLWKFKRLLNVGQESLLKKSLQIIDEFTYQLITTRRREIIASKASNSQDYVRPDILSRFIQLSEEPGNQLNDKSLRDVVLNFVIAGRDTTAVTLSWFIFMLTQHPHVAHHIYSELCLFEQQAPSPHEPPSTLPAHISHFAHLLTYDSIASLPYLHASLLETLRLYPAVPEDPKGIKVDDVLPNGMKLKKGCMITYSPYCMGRMQAIWGDDAYSFNPERWFKDGALQSISPFKFTTFQAGPRICIGKDSAFLQMKITTAILCRFFSFKLVQGFPVKYKTMAILAMEHGLEVFVSTRT